MTTQSFDKLTRGTAVLYRGDIYNQRGFGAIVAVREPTRWAEVSYDIVLEDGREMLGMLSTAFGGPGARFQLRTEYEQERVDQCSRSWAEHVKRNYGEEV